MSVLKITNENFEEEVKKSNVPVLVDFYANWCMPCKMMAPVVDEIAEELGENVKVGKLNVDDNQDIAIEYDVMTIPTLIIFKNGEVQKTFIGVQDKSDIIKELK